MSPRFLILFVFVGVLPSRGLTPDGEAELWRSVARLEIATARRDFAASGDGERARFGQALALLNTQPRSAERVETARKELLTIEREAGALASLATYFLGRIDQIHREPADVASARRRFERLVAEVPGTVVADVAATKLALLRLFQVPRSQEERLAAVDDIEALLPRVVNPAFRFSVHHALADACQYYGLGEARALRHLRDAEAIGTPAVNLQRRLLVRLVTSAARLRDRAVLHAAAERYLDRFPRGPEAGYVRRLREECENETRG